MIFVKICVLVSCLCGVMSMCPFPGMPGNGLGWISKSTNFSAIRPLEEGEIIHFNCYAPWEIPSDDVTYFKCTNGSFDGNALHGNAHVPKCALGIGDSNLTFSSGSQHFNPGCSSFETSEFQVQPEVKIRVNQLVEIWMFACPGFGEYSPVVKINNAIDCSLHQTKRLFSVFKCSNEHEEDIKFISFAIDQPFKFKRLIILIESDNYCGHPPVPINGEALRNGSGSFYFQCREGFWLHGSTSATCDPRNGRWGSIPTCPVDSGLTKIAIIIPTISLALILALTVFGYLIYKKHRRVITVDSNAQLGAEGANGAEHTESEMDEPIYYEIDDSVVNRTEHVYDNLTEL